MRTLRKRKGGPRLPGWPPPPGFSRAAPASQGGPRLPDFSGWAVELRGGEASQIFGAEEMEREKEERRRGGARGGERRLRERREREKEGGRRGGQGVKK